MILIINNIDKEVEFIKFIIYYWYGTEMIVFDNVLYTIWYLIKVIDIYKILIWILSLAYEHIQLHIRHNNYQFNNTSD